MRLLFKKKGLNKRYLFKKVLTAKHLLKQKNKELCKGFKKKQV